LAGRSAARPTAGVKSPPARPATTKPGADPRSNATRPASQYTVGRQLRDTEQAMAKAQKLVDRLHDQLESASDHTVLASVGGELATAQAELTALEERWLELAQQQSG
jgi:hypothetical protein